MNRRSPVRHYVLIAAAALSLLGLDTRPGLAASASHEGTTSGAKPVSKPVAGPPAPGHSAAGPQPAGPPAPGDVPPPYEPQLLRLSELLGALAYLEDLCGSHQGDVWRAKMAALLEAEAKTQIRKERLAGAFNRGFQGYALTYRQCTANAQAIIDRFLAESNKIARDVARQYGPS